MDDLIEALTILRRYDNPVSPTHCEHDTLLVMVDPALVSDEDLERLKQLGFIPSEPEYGFVSFQVRELLIKSRSGC